MLLDLSYTRLPFRRQKAHKLMICDHRCGDASVTFIMVTEPVKAKSRNTPSFLLATSI